MIEIVIRIALALLAVTFAWAALAKIVRFAEWREALEPYRLPRTALPLVAVAVPLSEGSVSAVILAGQSKPAAALALALLAGFSLAVLRAQPLAGGKLPCGCFGRVESHDYRVLLVRNAFLGVLTALVLVPSRSVALLAGIAMPRPGAEAVAAALVVAGLALIGWLAFLATHMMGEEQP